MKDTNWILVTMLWLWLLSTGLSALQTEVIKGQTATIRNELHALQTQVAEQAND